MKQRIAIILALFIYCQLMVGGTIKKTEKITAVARPLLLASTRTDTKRNPARDILLYDGELHVIVKTTEAIETIPTPEPVEMIPETTAAPTGNFAVAKEVWDYMKSLGWNDYVCAGIVGNMMAECGGHTLALNYTIFDPTGHFYGLCQWYDKYSSSVIYGDLYTQLDYLKSTIKAEMDNFGKNYARQVGLETFNYEAFLKMQDAGQAALAFADCYERCGSKYRNFRADLAEQAYAYFVG